jgi:hypothetical protein
MPFVATLLSLKELKETEKERRELDAFLVAAGAL